MVQIVWTLLALNDLASIKEFIAKDSIKYAQITTEKILQSVKRLETFPLSGRMVPEIKGNNIREIIFGLYRIVYNFNENVISILTVHHSARHFNFNILEN